jgi:CDP-4-dehydro-6-deoxyglucose reductase
MLKIFKKNKIPKRAALLQSNIDFEVLPRTTLLSSALSKGIDWPHRCKVGSCGTCKCRVVSGKVKPNIDFSYTLKQEELDKGFILACQSELISDIEVEINLNKNKERK